MVASDTAESSATMQSSQSHFLTMQMKRQWPRPSRWTQNAAPILQVAAPSAATRVFRPLRTALRPAPRRLHVRSSSLETTQRSVIQQTLRGSANATTSTDPSPHAPTPTPAPTILCTWRTWLPHAIPVSTTWEAEIPFPSPQMASATMAGQEASTVIATLAPTAPTAGHARGCHLHRRLVLLVSMCCACWS